MNTRSRSSLFLMEQLIVIIIFAIYSSVCVKIFAISYIMVNDTRDMNQALVAAKNTAEIFKICGYATKAEAVFQSDKYNYPNALQGGVVYYDKAWQVCNEAEAAFVLRLNELPENRENGMLPILYKLSVEKLYTGRMKEELLSFTVSSKRMHER